MFPAKSKSMVASPPYSPNARIGSNEPRKQSMADFEIEKRKCWPGEPAHVGASHRSRVGNKSEERKPWVRNDSGFSNEQRNLQAVFWRCDFLLRNPARIGVGLFMLACGLAFSAPSPELMAFQSMTSGRTYVREAVVMRSFFKPTGEPEETDAFRFGYSGSSWYLERLAIAPDADLRFERNLSMPVVGSTRTVTWAASPRNVHIAPVEDNSSSVPNVQQIIASTYVRSVLGMGFPSPFGKVAEWNGLNVSNMFVYTDPTHPKTNVASSVFGELKVDANGRPSNLTYRASGNYLGSSISYIYSNILHGLPSYIIEEPLYSGGSVCVSRIVSLDVTTNSEIEFTPAMFVDVTTKKVITIWSNETSFTVRKDRLTKNLGLSKEVSSGGKIVLLCFIGFGILVAVFFVVRRYQNLNNNDEK